MNLLGQEKLSRKGRTKQRTELQGQLEINEQKLTRKEMNEFKRQGDQRVTALQSQLERKEQKLTTMKKEMNEFQRQGDQRVTELQSQLETKEQELATMRKQINEYQGRHSCIVERYILEQGFL